MNHQILIEKEKAISYVWDALNTMRSEAKDTDWDFVISELQKAEWCAKQVRKLVNKEFN
jgi:hypothetical protein